MSRHYENMHVRVCVSSFFSLYTSSHHSPPRSTVIRIILPNFTSLYHTSLHYHSHVSPIPHIILPYLCTLSHHFHLPSPQYTYITLRHSTSLHYTLSHFTLPYTPHLLPHSLSSYFPSLHTPHLYLTAPHTLIHYFTSLYPTLTPHPSLPPSLPLRSGHFPFSIVTSRFRQI